MKFASSTYNLKTANPKLAAEWDYEKNEKLPEDVMPGSKYMAWWVCSECDYSWKALVYNRNKGSGCPACKVRKQAIRQAQATPTYNLKTANSKLAAEWDYTKNEKRPEDVLPCSHYKAWWVCSDCGHSWKAAANDRNKGSGCRVCQARKRALRQSQATPTNNIKAKNLTLSEEWDYEKNEKCPEDVMPNSNMKAWWVCSDCGYSWKALVSNRNNGSGCPVCKARKSALRQAQATSTTSLAATNLKLATEWDYTKNEKRPEDVLPGSCYVAWWICSKCCHSWKAGVNYRNNGNGCPKCSAGKSEAKVGELLKEALANLSRHDITITPQYAVRIKEKYKRRYDFALLQGSSVIAFVEYDGHQHFQPVRRSKSQSEEQLQECLKINQKRDKEKDQYAMDNNIPLIRTNYKEMEAFNKQIKNGIPEVETDLYLSLKANICNIINKNHD